MNSVVCTLFEGHYHYGVATLANSLYNQGFRGEVYVGYRGELPSWALKGKRESLGKWKDVVTLNPINGIKLVFISLDTTYSMTNYKPDFMLELWEGPAKDAEALFYFDPDIVVNESWAFFEEWVNCGVALCEDVNSPLQEFHPRRVGWRNYYKNYSIDLQFKNQIYVNGGFIGLLKKDISFLTLWIHLQEKMGEAIGSLANSMFLTSKKMNDNIALNIFDRTDQDALNATIEVCNQNISYKGKQGMGFESGHTSMFHALGCPKPWKTNHLLRTLNGRVPRPFDQRYWQNSVHPILAHSKLEKSTKMMSINISKFLGRFYKV